MAKVIAAAVRDRQEVPDEPLEIRADAARLRLVATSGGDETPREFTADSGRLRLTPRAVAQARERARRSRRPHNQARSVFAREIVNALTRQLAARIGTDVRTGAALLDQDDIADLRRELRTDPSGAGGDQRALADPHAAAARRRPALRSGPAGCCCAAHVGGRPRSAAPRAGRAVDARRRAAARRGRRAARRGRPGDPGGRGEAPASGKRHTPRACWTSSAATRRTILRS